MDLTLFIILVIISLMLYYLVQSVQSLIKEMKEVKNKCIKANNNKKEDFSINTPDPASEMTKNTLTFLNSLKKLF